MKNYYFKSFLMIVLLYSLCLELVAQVWNEQNKVFNPATYWYGNNSGTFSNIDIAISGNNAIVGNQNENDRGIVHFLELNSSGVWNITQTFKPNNFDSYSWKDDKFGASVAIDGDYAVVGAPKSNRSYYNGYFPDCGSAYIFKKNSSGIWVYQQKISGVYPNLNPGDNFGYSVDIDGSTIVAGAIGDDLGYGTFNSPNFGSIHVFNLNNQGTWVYDVHLSLDPFTDPTEIMGKQVAVSNNKIVVSAPKSKYAIPNTNSFRSEAGLVICYEKNANGTWIKTQTLNYPNTGNYCRFGWDLAMDDDNLAIISYVNTSSPRVVVYDYANGQWNQTQEVLYTNVGSNSGHYNRVSISNDYFVIGETSANVAPHSNIGVAKVYKKDAAGIWQQDEILSPENRTLNENFGGAVALDGDFALIGDNIYHNIVNGTQLNKGALIGFSKCGPQITIQPQNIYCSTSAIFEVGVAATSNLSYQWKRDDGTIPPGITTNETFNTTIQGSYYCELSNSCGSTSTDLVEYLVPNNPLISTQPSDIITCLGTNVTFNVQTNDPNITFQWRKNGVIIKNANSSSLVINPVTTKDIASYDCVLKETICELTTISNPVNLTLHPNARVSLDPYVNPICTGESITFNATGIAANSIEWRKCNNSTILQTGPTFTINNITASDAGMYCVSAVGQCNTDVLNFSVNVSAISPITITSQPTDVYCLSSGHTLLNVSATSTQALEYYWYEVGVPYWITNMNSFMAGPGEYYCKISNECNEIFTSNVIVSEDPEPGKYCAESKVGNFQSKGFNYELYPNPADDFIRLIGDEISQVQVHTLDGNEMNLNVTSNLEEILIQVNDLATGLYFIKFRQNNEVVIEKIMISR